jgi:hypothetical protein
MPSSNFGAFPLVRKRDNLTLHAYFGRFAFISIVSQYELARRQHSHQLSAENLDIRPPTTHVVGTVDPTNITSLNADTDLVSDTRCLVFV